MTLPDIASHARTLTRPPVAGKLRLRAGKAQPPPASFACPPVAPTDRPWHWRVT